MGNTYGNLFIVSAPSGGGKTSLVRSTIEVLNNLRISVSHTTRAKRPNERDGVDYYFVTITEFQRMVDDGTFLEYATVFGHRYGTSLHTVNETLGRGQDVILDIDWQGAQAIRRKNPETVSVFVLPPTIEELEHRLTKRGGDTREVIQQRMQNAVMEIAHYGEYDYLLVNDNFDQTVEALVSIIKTARLRRVTQQKRHEDLLTKLMAN